MSAFSEELEAMVSILDSVFSDLDNHLRNGTPEDVDLPDALQCRTVLTSASLALIRERLDTLIGDKLTKYKTTVPGFGVVERHEKTDPRKVEDDDALWRTVLDTRVVDETTGEVLAPLEVVKMVYGQKSKDTGEVRLTGATPSKLSAIGLDPDSFFTEKVRRPGWTLRVY